MASKTEIDKLPKYWFRRTYGDNQEPSGGIMTPFRDTRTKYVLSLEDAKCCICLSAYHNVEVLRGLPCGHHFHSSCIDQWLRIDPTCPICKFDISSTRKLSSSCF